MFISKKEVIGVLGTALGASEQKKKQDFRLESYAMAQPGIIPG
jgi:hypothetical protein